MPLSPASRAYLRVYGLDLPVAQHRFGAIATEWGTLAAHVFLPPDPDVDYLTIGGGQGDLHMFSRSDVVLLGAVFKPGDFTRLPEPEETERIVTEHERLFSQSG